MINRGDGKFDEELQVVKDALSEDKYDSLMMLSLAYHYLEGNISKLKAF
jgi:hypothetical protein